MNLQRTVARRTPAILVLAASAIVAACASHGGPPPQTAPRVDPAVLARVQADLRMVGTESTWVAHGSGYELAALSKTDIALTQQSLDRAAHAFSQAFDTTPPQIEVALIDPAGDKSDQKSTPVPATKVPVVQVMVGGPGAMRAGPPSGRDDNEGGERGENGGEEGGESSRFGRGGGRGFGGAEGLRGSNSAMRGPMRAWLSARASALDGRAALAVQAAGVALDPRVPHWAEDAVPGLALDSSVVQGMVSQLAAEPDSLHPLDSLLVMRRPADVFFTTSPQAGGREGGEGGFSGGRGGFGGGFGGGRGGFGGERGGMRGRGGRGQANARPALRGGALFTAEAIVFAHYVATRENPAFVGRILDAQMQGKPWSSALSSAKSMPSNVRDLEADWRHWISYHGAHKGG